MARPIDFSDEPCDKCQWMVELLLKVAMVFDRLGSELKSACEGYEDATPETKQLLKGRLLQQTAVVKMFGNVMDEERFDLAGDGNLH